MMTIDKTKNGRGYSQANQPGAGERDSGARQRGLFFFHSDGNAFVEHPASGIRGGGGYEDLTASGGERRPGRKSLRQVILLLQGRRPFGILREDKGGVGRRNNDRKGHGPR